MTDQTRDIWKDDLLAYSLRDQHGKGHPMTIAEAAADFRHEVAFAKRLERFARARFARALREAHESGVSLRKLAKEAGYSHAQVDNIIKGR